MIENIFEVDDLNLYKKICGYQDKNVRRIEELLGVSIIPRGNTLIIKADKEKNEHAVKLLHLLTDYLHLNGVSSEIEDFDLKYMANSVKSGEDIKSDEINKLKVTINETGRTIVPKTINQAKYISAIHNSPITFSIGPAGTGKTYLAVVVALHYFLKGKVEKIVLTRPAVEAGESLGYLPGDLIQKINPYLRPLYDALFDLMSFEKVSKCIETESIEIAPLAYMRGRTLNNSFIILDEAQNTTASQMKMFLTRLGNNSRIVVTGDVTQIDIDRPKKSGLLNAMKILKDINEINFIKFTKKDISRHPIVEKIVAAYEQKGQND